MPHPLREACHGFAGFGRRGRRTSVVRALVLGNAPFGCPGTSFGHEMVDIALQVGYESEAGFSRAFKRAVGVAPGGQ